MSVQLQQPYTATQTKKALVLEQLRLLFSQQRFAEMRLLILEHGVYEVAGELIEELIEQKEYELAKEVLLDLVAGPFFERFHLHMYSQVRDEYTIIPRMLYVLHELLCPIPHPDVRHILSYFKQGQTFERFIKRYELPAVKINAHKDLETYAQRLTQSLDEHPHTHTAPTGRVQRELRLYELHEALSGVGRAQEYDSAQTVALMNVMQLLNGEATKQYERTLLKLDCQSLQKTLDETEFLDLMKKLHLYDFHLSCAYNAYERKEYSKAYEIVREFCEESTVLRNSTEYYKILAREATLQFIVKLAEHLSYE